MGKPGEVLQQEEMRKSVPVFRTESLQKEEKDFLFSVKQQDEGVRMTMPSSAMQLDWESIGAFKEEAKEGVQMISGVPLSKEERRSVSELMQDSQAYARQINEPAQQREIPLSRIEKQEQGWETTTAKEKLKKLYELKSRFSSRHYDRVLKSLTDAIFNLNDQGQLGRTEDVQYENITAVIEACDNYIIRRDSETKKGIGLERLALVRRIRKQFMEMSPEYRMSQQDREKAKVYDDRVMEKMEKGFEEQDFDDEKKARKIWRERPDAFKRWHLRMFRRLGSSDGDGESGVSVKAYLREKTNLKYSNAARINELTGVDDMSRKVTDVFLNGYRTDENGEPLTEADRLYKERDMKILDDFVKDGVRTGEGRSLSGEIIKLKGRYDRAKDETAKEAIARELAQKEARFQELVAEDREKQQRYQYYDEAFDKNYALLRKVIGGNLTATKLMDMIQRNPQEWSMLFRLGGSLENIVKSDPLYFENMSAARKHTYSLIRKMMTVSVDITTYDNEGNKSVMPVDMSAVDIYINDIQLYMGFSETKKINEDIGSVNRLKNTTSALKSYEEGMKKFRTKLAQEGDYDESMFLEDSAQEYERMFIKDGGSESFQNVGQALQDYQRALRQVGEGSSLDPMAVQQREALKDAVQSYLNSHSRNPATQMGKERVAYMRLLMENITLTEQSLQTKRAMTLEQARKNLAGQPLPEHDKALSDAVAVNLDSLMEQDFDKWKDIDPELEKQFRENTDKVRTPYLVQTDTIDYLPRLKNRGMKQWKGTERFKQDIILQKDKVTKERLIPEFSGKNMEEALDRLQVLYEQNEDMDVKVRVLREFIGGVVQNFISLDFAKLSPEYLAQHPEAVDMILHTNMVLTNFLQSDNLYALFLQKDVTSEDWKKLSSGQQEKLVMEKAEQYMGKKYIEQITLLQKKMIPLFYLISAMGKQINMYPEVAKYNENYQGRQDAQTMELYKSIVSEMYGEYKGMAKL